MTELNEIDSQKLYTAIASIRRSIQCTLCHNLPKETRTPKCGHPFCKVCIEKILCKKKAICSICKAVITRGTIRVVEGIDKIGRDLDLLSEAIDRDLDGKSQSSNQSEVVGLRQYPGKHKGPSQPGPALASAKITEIDSASSDLTKINSGKETNELKTLKTIYKTVDPCTDSEETIKIPRKQSVKQSEAVFLGEPSTSSPTTDNFFKPVLTRDTLPIAIEAIGSKKKVEDWLNTEEYKDEIEEQDVLPEILVPRPDSPSISEILESYSRTKSNLAGVSSKSESNSQSLKTAHKNEEGNMNTGDTKTKFKSFTFEETNKKKILIPETAADKIFNELRKTTVNEQSEKKKLKVLAENTWSELAEFKKETHSKVRKRKRLNVSIERPNSTKQIIGLSDTEDSEEDEKHGKDLNNTQNGKNKKSKAYDNNNTVVESPTKKKRPTVISSRALGQNETYDIHKLNRDQVMKIIGITNSQENPYAPKNSTNTLEESQMESNNIKPTKSTRHSRNKSIDKESMSYLEESLRPQSKQSNHPNDSRPNSRLSLNSTGKPASGKFKLSISGKSPAINRSANAAQSKEEEPVKIRLTKSSPVRVSSNSIKNKLRLKKLSSDSSHITDEESRNSVVSFHKLGKLLKRSNRIKFTLRGSTRTQADRRSTTMRNIATQTSPRRCGCTKTKTKKKNITTRSIMIQTSPRLDYNESLSNNSNKNDSSSESMHSIVNIPATRTGSIVLSNSKEIENVHNAQRTPISKKTITLHESPKIFDTVNKVNMLSPEKDSQLKFLVTKSPSVSKMDCTDSYHSVQTINKHDTVTKKTNSTDLNLEMSDGSEYIRMVKKYGQKLLLTDSEDQDSPNENLFDAKRKSNHESPTTAVTANTTTSISSKTTSNLSDIGMDDNKSKAVKSRVVTNTDKSSPSIYSVENNAEKKLSHTSPESKKYSRDSVRSQTKTKSAEKLKSLRPRTSRNHCNNFSISDAETSMVAKSKEKRVYPQDLEDSDISTIAARHRVVRKLDYSQESGINSNLESEKSGHLKQQIRCDKMEKSSRTSETRTFQRIRTPSSTDSEVSLLRISLPSKQSSSNSQMNAKPGFSREVNKSPILSDDMTIIFSSSKETQESKRKRSLSPHVLSNKDPRAKALKRCADLNKMISEVTTDTTNDGLLVRGKKYLSDNMAPPKKPRVDYQISDSFNSEEFPALSPTGICGNQKTVKATVEFSTEANSQFLNSEESTLINDLDEAARQFDYIDANIKPDGSRTNINTIKNTKHINSTENIERSVKRGNTFSGTTGTTSKSSTPLKSKSLESKNLPVVQNQSQNSDKENKQKNQSKKSKVNGNMLAKRSQKVSLNEDFIESMENETENVSKSRSMKDLSCSPNINELSNSSFDRDCLNITEEELLMQKFHDNLFGTLSENVIKNSNEEVTQEKTVEKTPKKKSNNQSNQKVKDHQTAQDNSDDSEIIDEEIIESTPENDATSKKDCIPDIGSTQASRGSVNSFMSVNMTPIQKLTENNAELSSNHSSPIEQSPTQLLRDKRSLLTNVGSRPTSHSTPKVGTLLGKRKLNRLENVKDKLCFVCSCLSLLQVQNVIAFASKYNAEYTTAYKPEVTHVIVDTKERDTAARTLKFLFGIAHKKWVVSYRWVIDCMSRNQILEEEDYEAIDGDTQDPGPRRSRLSDKPLFQDFAFTCMKPFLDVTVDQLQDLLCSTGGTIVENLEDLASVTNKHKIILYNSDRHDLAALETWRLKGNGLPVMVEWILTCISQYNLVSFREFLQIDANVLSDYNFPEYLITEEEDEESVND